MSVPPISSSLQVPVGQSASMPAPVALTSDTAAIAPLPPVLFFLPVTSSGTLIRLQHLRLCLSSRKGRGPLSLPCWLKPSRRPKTSPRLRMSLSLQTSHKTLRSSHHVKLQRPTLDHTPRLVDPTAVTLPLHSTPMDEASGVQGALDTQHVSPVFGKLPYPVTDRRASRWGAGCV